MATTGSLSNVVDPSTPEPVAYVRDLLHGLGAPWFLCGGWAVDAWLGRQTRDHGDVDIAVFHHDQRVVFDHFTGWVLVAHDPNVPDDTAEPWNGRHLDLPAHIHVPTRGSDLAGSTTGASAVFGFEFLLNERTGNEWVLNDQRRIAVGPNRRTRNPAWGLPTAPPEVVLFYKAGAHLTGAEPDGGPRPRDEHDLFALLPILTEAERSWLRASIAEVRPEHPWLAHLAS